MHDGLYVAIYAGCHNIIVEGDNKIVIEALQGKVKTPWQIQRIIKDIHT